MISAPLISGWRQLAGWALFSALVLAVPVWALLDADAPTLPHLARLPNTPLQTIEGRLIDSHAFLGEVLVVELGPVACSPEAPGCAARGAALERMAAELEPEAPVRLLSLLPVEGGPARGSPDPTRWNLLRVPAPGLPGLQGRLLGDQALPEDALLLFDAEGSLRAIFAADEQPALLAEARRLARGLPVRQTVE